MSDPVVNLQDVHKEYRRGSETVKVLRGVDCQIECELPAIFRRDASSSVASIVHAERTTQTIFAHHTNQTIAVE